MNHNTRENTDYATWYSPWMKQLALTCTRMELERKLNGNRRQIAGDVQSHFAAITATSSMSSNSQRRSQARSVVAATGTEAIAIRGALEIYRLFPEHAMEATA